MEIRTSNIRLLHKEIRDNMSVLEYEKASAGITQNVLALLESDFKGANIFLCYYPFASEIDLIPLYEAFLAKGKTLYFPISIKEDHSLDFKKVTNLNDCFTPGFHGIMEPLLQLESLDDKCQNAVVITPGLVFDKKMNRIGYGGGFYDRFFEKHPLFYRIAPAFSHQIEEDIFVKSHDLPMDYIITENEIMKGDRL